MRGVERLITDVDYRICDRLNQAVAPVRRWLRGLEDPAVARMEKALQQCGSTVQVTQQPDLREEEDFQPTHHHWTVGSGGDHFERVVLDAMQTATKFTVTVCDSEGNVVALISYPREESPGLSDILWF